MSLPALHPAPPSYTYTNPPCHHPSRPQYSLANAPHDVPHPVNQHPHLPMPPPYYPYPDEHSPPYPYHAQDTRPHLPSPLRNDPPSSSHVPHHHRTPSASSQSAAATPPAVYASPVHSRPPPLHRTSYPYSPTAASPRTSHYPPSGQIPGSPKSYSASPSEGLRASPAARSFPHDRETFASRSAAPRPYTQLPMDYSKMMEIYQSIMALASQEVDEFQLEQLASQMQHPATAGLRLFETPGDDQSPTLGKRHRFREDSGQLSLGPSLSSKRTKDSSRDVPQQQHCGGCFSTSTPEWRRGPYGPRTLCNACGLVYAKILKRRNRDEPDGEGEGYHSSDDASEEAGLTQRSPRM